MTDYMDYQEYLAESTPDEPPTEVCPACNGNGEIIGYETPCIVCHGDCERHVWVENGKLIDPFEPSVKEPAAAGGGETFPDAEPF